MLKIKTNDVFERIRTGLAGRSRQVVALATLAGVASIGLAAATLDNAPAPTSLTTAAGNADQARAEAAEQADRSARGSRTPAATPETSSPGLTASLTAPATPKAAKAAPAWVNPMSAGEVSSCYGPRWGTMHAGVDLFTDENEPIVSVGKGTVVAAGWAYSGYGISVVVDHHNGYLTHYAHMNKTAVGEGDEVKAGDVLGYEGSTGDSTGPHLHFEVHAGMWNQIDPAPWLAERGIDLAC